MTVWETKDVITVSIAVLGAVLGVLNWWNAYSGRRVRIIVKPTFAYSFDNFGNISEHPRIGIEVVNLSAFAVTVTEVGFRLNNSKMRASQSRPDTRDGKLWPRRLEAREAVSTYIGPPNDQRYKVTAVYARLASGEQFIRRGSFIKKLQSAIDAGHV